MFGPRKEPRMSSCNEEENDTFLIASLFVPAQSDNSILLRKTTNIGERTFFNNIRKIIKTDSFTFNSYVNDYIDYLSSTDNTIPLYILSDGFVCKTFNSLPYKSNFNEGLVFYLVEESVSNEEGSRCK